MKSNKTSITRNARLLCSECDVPRRVANVQFDSFVETVVSLRECGHKRGELLPLREGRISLEHIERAEAIGYSMFPVIREAA